MAQLQENLSLDYRIIRVALAADNPIEVIHKINTDSYSIITLLDTLEVLDVKITLEEHESKRAKAQQETARK